MTSPTPSLRMKTVCHRIPSGSRSGKQIVLALSVLLAVWGTSSLSFSSALQSADPHSTERFQILAEYRGEAVLDRDTQLIWERNPSQAGMTWSSAPMHCALKAIGGHGGWRLPSFLELMTLVQPSVHQKTASPNLPTGHPFRGVQADSYWTGTGVAADHRLAYIVDFAAGDVAQRYKGQTHPSWCVRDLSPLYPAQRASSPQHDTI